MGSIAQSKAGSVPAMPFPNGHIWICVCSFSRLGLPPDAIAPSHSFDWHAPVDQAAHPTCLGKGVGWDGQGGSLSFSQVTLWLHHIESSFCYQAQGCLSLSAVRGVPGTI